MGRRYVGHFESPPFGGLKSRLSIVGTAELDAGPVGLTRVQVMRVVGPALLVATPVDAVAKVDGSVGRGFAADESAVRRMLAALRASLPAMASVRMMKWYGLRVCLPAALEGIYIFERNSGRSKTRLRGSVEHTRKPAAEDTVR